MEVLSFLVLILSASTAAAPLLRRRYCGRLPPAAVNRYRSPALGAGRSAANPLHAAAAVDRCDRQTDGHVVTPV